MSNQPPHQPGPYPGDAHPPGYPAPGPGPSYGGPGYGGPGYGYQGPGPTPPRRHDNGKLWAIGLVAGLCVVLVVVIAAVAGDGGSSGSSPQAAASGFIDAINDGDRDAAQELVCDVAISPPDVDEYVDGGAQLSLQDEVRESEIVPQAVVAGTLRGERVEGGLMVERRQAEGQLTADADAPWCVSALHVGRPYP